MIPRIETGSSFRGAGLYYLHDKGTLETSERVAWTLSNNCVFDDPAKALDEMWRTAEDQKWLKLQSGNRTDGANSTRPVMTISLSWAKDEKPTREEMTDAGHSFLEHMGWDMGHQSLFVCHNDTDHQHIHIILNKVNQFTGMNLDDDFAKRRSQEWALEYEKSRGHVYCLKREENAQNRGEKVRAAEQRDHVRHYGQWLAARDEMQKEGMLTPELETGRQSIEWRGLKDSQRREREAFWKESSDMRRALRREAYLLVREEFKDEWDKYGERKADWTSQTKANDERISKEMRAYLRLSQGVKGQGFQALKDQRKEFRAAVSNDLTEVRDDLKARQEARLQEVQKHALETFNKDRAVGYQEQLAAHREEKVQLHTDQKAHRPRGDLIAQHYDPTRGITANENPGPSSPHERELLARQRLIDGVNHQSAETKERARIAQQTTAHRHALHRTAAETTGAPEMAPPKPQLGLRSQPATERTPQPQKGVPIGTRRAFEGAAAETVTPATQLPRDVQAAHAAEKKRKQTDERKAGEEYHQQRREAPATGRDQSAAVKLAAKHQAREREQEREARARGEDGGGRTRGGRER